MVLLTKLDKNGNTIITCFNENCKSSKDRNLIIDKNFILEEFSNLLLSNKKFKDYYINKVPINLFEEMEIKKEIAILEEALLNELIDTKLLNLRLYTNLHKKKTLLKPSITRPMFTQTVAHNELVDPSKCSVPISMRRVELHKMIFRYYFSEDLNLLIYIKYTRPYYSSYLESSLDSNFLVELSINSLPEDFKTDEYFFYTTEVDHFIKNRHLLSSYDIYKFNHTDLLELRNKRNCIKYSISY